MWKIALCGLAGVGKGTVGPMLAQELGVQFYSGGDSFGAIAKSKGVSKAELESIAVLDLKVDQEVDEGLRKFGLDNLQRGWVIEGRRAAHVLADIPNLRKILLTCSDPVRFQRIMDRDKHASPEAAQEATLKREAETSQRYVALYKQTLAELVSPNGFDFIFNTGRGTPAEQCQRLIHWLKLC